MPRFLRDSVDGDGMAGGGEGLGAAEADAAGAAGDECGFHGLLEDRARERNEPFFAKATKGRPRRRGGHGGGRKGG